MKTSLIDNKRFKLIGAAVIGLILVGVAAPSALTKPLSPQLVASVVGQECTPTNDVNVTLTATLTPPKADAMYVWDFNNDGVFDTPPSIDPTVSHEYPDENTFTAVVGVMKGSQLKDTASVTFTTILCQNPWSVQYMNQPRYDMRTATFPSDAVFVTDSWERYDNISNSWSNGLLSDTRIGIAAAQSGSKAYFAGGKKGPYTDYVYVKSTDIYDDVSHLWSRTSLSTAREVGGAGSVGGKLFFAGGRSAITMYKIVDIFDAATGARSVANLVQARTNIAVGTAGNKIVFAGGWYLDFNFNQLYSNIVDIYDVATGLWTRSTLSQKRDTISVASVGNKILFAGGLANTGISRNVDIYDVSTGTWTTASLSVPRYGATVNVVGSKAYFAGSANGVPTVDVYDSTTNGWSVLAMPDTLAAMSGAVIGNQIFYAGGYDPVTYAVSDVVQIYDTVSGTWSSANLSDARAGITSVIFADRALFAGGLTKVTYPPIASATVDVYSFRPNRREAVQAPLATPNDFAGTGAFGVQTRAPSTSFADSLCPWIDATINECPPCPYDSKWLPDTGSSQGCSRCRRRDRVRCVVLSWHWAASDLLAALGGAGSSAYDRSATPRRRCFSPRWGHVAGRRNESMELFHPRDRVATAAPHGPASRPGDCLRFGRSVRAQLSAGRINLPGCACSARLLGGLRISDRDRLASQHIRKSCLHPNAGSRGHSDRFAHWYLGNQLHRISFCRHGRRPA